MPFAAACERSIWHSILAIHLKHKKAFDQSSPRKLASETKITFTLFIETFQNSGTYSSHMSLLSCSTLLTLLRQWLLPIHLFVGVMTSLEKYMVKTELPPQYCAVLLVLPAHSMPQAEGSTLVADGLILVSQ
jgi:hypothetical protein